MSYVLAEIWRPRPEWYSLPRQQKEKLVSRGGELIGEVVKKGAKVVGAYRCRATSDGGWDMIGIWEMPSFELVSELAKLTEKLGWNRYFEQINVVGERIELEEYFSGLLEETET